MMVYAKVDGKLAKWSCDTSDPKVAIDAVKQQVTGMANKTALAVVK